MTMTPDKRLGPPTAQSEEANSENGDDKTWLRKARAAWRDSTSYLDTNFRKQWEDSIRAFNNQHPSDSKYNSPAYDKRSKLYRPKIRAIIRKNEAAAAAAFFSNMDTVSIGAQDQSNKAQLASATVMKNLLQYRLTKSIPWYQIVLGGIQDAQTMGVVCGKVDWLYEPEEDGNQEQPEGEGELPKAKTDKPVVELVPIENVRFSPAASWIDPVNTSPYFIELIPMFGMDVQAKMDNGEWFEYPLNSATSGIPDSTRSARAGGKDDPKGGDVSSVDDYDVVWIQLHIHRHEGRDWVFYTLSDRYLLTDPVPIEEMWFHGRRPYVVGCCVLEAHKAMPNGVPTLARGLADEVNEIANQRIDNVKFALNKKWFAKRGVEVDIAGLVRNVPGGVVMMNDPVNDVREITWPDVTASSYQEQQGIDMLTDELLGNFNPAALMVSGAGNAPARNMNMLNQSTGTLVEYLIRTYVETFVQPVLRLLILMEQKYETDRVVLALAGKNAQLVQKFGIDEVTDELLNQELTLTVNVGMGATDPTQKLQKFLMANNSFAQMMRNPVPGMNMVEVGKEIYGHLGYQDGSRFFTNDNPQVVALQQQLQKAMGLVQQLQGKLKEKSMSTQASIIRTRETNQSKERVESLRQENENKRALASHFGAIYDRQHDLHKHYNPVKKDKNG